MEIDGKVAVVSGAASGIGRAAVLALAVRGAKVVVADVDEDGGRQTVEMAGAKGGTAAFRRCNVTKTEDLGSALDWAVEHLQRVASILVCLQVDVTSANQTRPSSRPQMCIMRDRSCSLKPAVGRFDIAFNNAGISGEDLFADEPGHWARIIDINLTAVIDATRLAVRKMRLTSNAGVIINTASLIGL